MKRVRDNALTVVMLLLFGLSLLGQTLAGWGSFNQDQTDHHQATIELLEYLGTGHFGEAVFENWESEFLQMGILVILTARFRQKGSPESKAFDGPEEVDREPDPTRRGAPWPVRAGGLVGRVYEHSLGGGLLLLFFITFGLHVWTGAAAASADNLAHGQPAISAIEYLGTPRLWFESFQNWQSEFLSIAALTVLSIFLRERGSSESKPVDAPHEQTGGEP
jgi:Domain of unknown function (DUF6766)